MIGRSRRRNLAVGALIVGSLAVGGLWEFRRSAAPALSASERESTEEPEPFSAMPVGSAVALAPAPTETPPPAGAPASEEEALREIARLNVTDKPRALALALSTDAAYPSIGAYAEARRAMIITLLVDLDRMEEARQRVYPYLDAYPGSPYVPLVEGKTGIHPRPRGPR